MDMTWQCNISSENDSVSHTILYCVLTTNSILMCFNNHVTHTQITQTLVLNQST
jgi:hypothetical protein